MTGHTPGPWSAPHFATDHTCSCHYVLSGNQTGMGAIATVHSQCEKLDGCEHNEPIEVAKANARLIAAAPELLEALVEAVEWNSHDEEGEPAVWLEMAESAIAKATGR